MAKYTIEYERDGCIGSGTCAGACPNNWKISAEDGKADYVNADFEEDQLRCNKEAAESCPVNVIHIKNNETGDRII